MAHQSDRTKTLLVTAVALLIVFALASHTPLLIKRSAPYQQAKSIRIRYPPIDEPSRERAIDKSIQVVDSGEVQDILATLDVVRHESSYMFMTTGIVVEFIYPDRRAREVEFLGMKMLQVNNGDDPDHGLLHLASTRFYDKVCETISKAEGKPFPRFKDADFPLTSK